MRWSFAGYRIHTKPFVLITIRKCSRMRNTHTSTLPSYLDRDRNDVEEAGDEGEGTPCKPVQERCGGDGWQPRTPCRPTVCLISHELQGANKRRDHPANQSLSMGMQLV